MLNQVAHSSVCIYVTSNFNLPNFGTFGMRYFSSETHDFILSGMNFESIFLSAFETRSVFYHSTHIVYLFFLNLELLF